MLQLAWKRILLGFGVEGLGFRAVDAPVGLEEDIV
jgi:hypothetical protein